MNHPLPAFTYVWQVSCTATDNVGLTSEASFTITVTCMSASGLIKGSASVSAANLLTFDYTAITAGGLYPITAWEVPGTIIAPGDMAVEAAGSSGAVVTFFITTTNDVDYACTPASGSIFPIGNTTVQCSILGSDTASATFVVTVVPPTPPVFDPTTLPNVTANATSVQGALVQFPVFTASDVHSGPPIVACLPPSNSFFTIGTTPVFCSATDGVGNSASQTFYVTVLSSTFPEPTLQVPVNISYELIPGSTSRIVTYDVTPSVDLPFTCTPPSGSYFSPQSGGSAPNNVSCKFDGSVTEYTFGVWIWPSTAPVFTPPPSDVTVSANHSRGAILTIPHPAAIDAHSGPPTVDCDPPLDDSYLFPHGETTVTCVAVDGVGMQASASFMVKVENPCDSNPSPCGPAEVAISCNPIGVYDFTCTCQAGYIQGPSGACTRSLTQQVCTNGTTQWLDFQVTNNTAAYSICTPAALCFTAGPATDLVPVVTMAGKDLNGAPDQSFYIRPVIVNSLTLGYTLIPMQQPTKCLAVRGGSYANGADLVLADCARYGATAPPEQIFGLPISSNAGAQAEG
ncbi:hypothetical protein GPECTOR_23g123 [Gonium pectorale]|uniref:HYR domain-containing protein n=1 Tax=Gonium pectorale TaxID=33097 RepID=A0A150GGS9_GONPE|nr:hypothetical protein GPECTOR_23g123 [Gonium pectorale]|eukprot:KXZ49036.1 hypothetical protein GPECTOR_23g123 [Gonium pectorale]